jgi:hypothetical protein
MKNIAQFEDFINESTSPLQPKETPSIGFEVASKMMEVITPEEAQFLSDYYNKKGKEAVAEKIAEVGEIEEGSMSPEEYKFRSILDKIITKGGIGAMLAVVPVAMAGAPFLAMGLGIAALAGCIFKDAAWWGREGHHYEESDRARADWYNGKKDSGSTYTNTSTGSRPKPIVGGIPKILPYQGSFKK